MLPVHFRYHTMQKNMKLQFGSIVSSDDSGSGVGPVENTLQFMQLETQTHKHAHAKKKLVCNFLKLLIPTWTDRREREETQLSVH